MIVGGTNERITGFPASPGRSEQMLHWLLFFRRSRIHGHGGPVPSDRHSEKHYLPIAKQHGISLFQLEKNIRTVRDVIMRNDGQELLKKLNGGGFCQKSQPYPKELIAIFANYLREA